MVDTGLDRDVSATCIDDATIAAFVDGTLDSEERSRVVAHLASCPDCQELVGEVVRTQEELPNLAGDVTAGSLTSDPPKPGPVNNVLWFRRRGFAAAAGLVAIAASVLFLVLNRGNQLRPLVDVVGEERLTLARPTGDFHYGPLRSPMRGPRETAGFALLAEAAKLRERATRTGAARDLHASGVAQLLAGDVANGIEALEAAARLKPNDAAVRADLGAAYMTRFVNSGNQADADAALDAFDKAFALDPAASKEAWFNKALLLERLGRPADALLAWDSYLALPNEPGWREEALRQRDALQQKIK